ncbi:helix-turn-helix domain-containing protein [Diaminobutyricibacter tongyongensis]|uniref:Helix-turn-helix domain-containing protein n=1 Tax=Leifsonia tongyongensis TaxID=1268043 RepID=A0A6L9XXT0_9MICO|nr:helix-turn-helix domain-containing protein [Diaminobutyricibacter tongyongensis]NEN05844.1 helix-turn-helix domain-containing protein [Diaminobutyricibacter tongyongensis]
MAAVDVFWEDLREDLKDPEFLREYVANWVRITTTDAIVNALDDAREHAGMSKAALARAINAEPSALRRLFGRGRRANPTVGTVAELAAALGMRLTLEPLSLEERESTTRPLLDGEVRDARALVERLGTPALVQ